MNPNTGEIHRLHDAEIASLERARDAHIERMGERLAPLTERQHQELRPLGAAQRKGYMRNQPCVCGSGKKFKACCWDKYT
jgi:uncharacterized protein YecA (UPF0149 family)